MTARYLLRVALLALAFTFGTHVVGWWAVPVLGLVWGIVGRGTARPGLTAGISAAIGWAGMLLGSWLSGPIPLLAEKLGTITGLGGFTWVAATILFPLSLAWSAATVAGHFAPRPSNA